MHHTFAYHSLRAASNVCRERSTVVFVSSLLRRSNNTRHSSSSSSSINSTATFFPDTVIIRQPRPYQQQRQQQEQVKNHPVIVVPRRLFHSSGKFICHAAAAPTSTRSKSSSSSTTTKNNDDDNINNNNDLVVPITFIDRDGTTEIHVQAKVGKNLLDVAQENNIELEGACGGELACATCHLVFEKEIYDTLDEKDPEEDDMLDLAFELTETSRLGCQIHVRPDMAGMIVKIPNDGY